MTGAVRHEKNERFPEKKTTTGVGADARGTCTQCGSLSTCMMISCPASSRPRSRPPMPEKSDTVFMLRAEDGGARGSVMRSAVSWFFFFVVEHGTTPGYSTRPSSGTLRDLRVGAGGAEDGCDGHGGGSIMVLGCNTK